MIPEVAAVVEAALALVADPHSGISTREGTGLELTRAVEAYKIRASRPAGAVTYEEQDRTWGEVVAGDEILSAKTGRFYEVFRSVLSPDGKSIKVNIKGAGAAKPIIRPVGDPVRLKRGISGDAVDLFQVLFSGDYTLGGGRDTAAGAGPMLASTEEDEERLATPEEDGDEREGE